MKEENNINNNLQNHCNYSNDYSYPTLKREDLMYLSSIDIRDFPKKKINQLNTKRTWSLNLFNLDIEKSTPKKYSKYLNKIDFINRTDDIDNAQPLKKKILKYPDFILNTRDIEKAFPSRNINLSEKKKIINNPQIELNKIEEENYPMKKFIRNQIEINDIEGTKPKSLYRNYIKMNNQINNFEKESPYKRIKEKQYFYDNMNYNDVYENNKKFRNTNPLDPDYGINYGGDIEKSHPYIPSYHIKNRGNLYMSNDDIKGSLPGSKNKYNYFNINRNYIYNVNDIDGAYADSKKYGIVTKRCTNPLNPKYQYLGFKENLDCYGRKNKNYKFEISKENEGIILGNRNIINKENKGNFEFKENKRYEFDKDKMVSQSCNNIFYKGENKKNNDIYNSLLLNYNRDNYQKPIFNPDDFKKPNPNYERIHNENLKFSSKNPDNRLDNMMKKNMALFPSLKNNDKNYIKNLKNNIQETKNVFRLNHSNSARLFPTYNMKNEYENRTIKDTLYSKINQVPTYEVQLSNYLKDNSYKQ